MIAKMPMTLSDERLSDYAAAADITPMTMRAMTSAAAIEAADAAPRCRAAAAITPPPPPSRRCAAELSAEASCFPPRWRR